MVAQAPISEAATPFIEPEVPRSGDPFRWITIFSIAILAIALGCAAVTALSTFPLIEGWYEALLFLQKHGLRPYSDVEFVLPPMTILLYHFYDSISHSEFAITKMLGLGLTLVNCAILCIWLCRQVTKPAAILASVLMFVVLTAEPLYAASDYHDLVQFFVTMAVVITLTSPSFRVSPNITILLLSDALLGAIAQALFLTKQNVGLGVGAALAFLLVARIVASVVRGRGREVPVTLARLGTYVAAFFVTGWLILRATGIQDSYCHFVSYLIGIQSKGSAVFAATRLLHDPNNNTELLPGFLLGVGFIFLYLLLQYLLQLKSAGLLSKVSLLGDRFPTRYLTIGKVVGAAAITLYIFKLALDQMIAQDPIWLWNFWPTIFTVAAFIIDIFSTTSVLAGGTGVQWLRTGLWLSVSRVVLFAAIFYSNSLTASMNVLPLIVLFGFYAAFGIDFVFRFAARQPTVWLRSFLFGVVVVVSIFVFRLELSKLDVPYSWWGLQEAPVFSSSASLDLPYMRGLRFAPDRVENIEGMVSDIDASTNASDPILTYPDIPVFYMLTDRLPMTRTYVQWFDFSTNASLIPDFRHVSEAPPKVIVEMAIPRSVYQGHEGLLGRALPQSAFSEYLQCMVSSGAFANIRQFYYSQTDALGGTFRIRSARPLSVDDVGEIAAVVRNYKPAAAVVTGALGLDDSGLPLSQMQTLVDKSTPEFGGVVVVGKGEALQGLLSALTASLKTNFSPYDDQYIVRLLRRDPAWESRGAACKATLSTALDTY